MSNQTIIVTPYIVDLAGGLGDVLNVFYLTEAMAVLEENKNTLVILRSHNRFVEEFVKQQGYVNVINLFDAWPTATGEFFVEAKPKLESICGIDFCSSEVLAIKERAYLPRPKSPDLSSVKFFFDKKEKLILEYLSSKKNLVAIQYSAGSEDRDIPEEILRSIVSSLIEKGYTPVIIGSSAGKDFLFPDKVINLHNTGMTIGSTVEVVKMCSYFIGSHSSMNLVAWHNKVKSLILMPENTYYSHFFDTLKEKTVWNFGAFDSWNRVVVFKDYTEAMLDRFLG